MERRIITYGGYFSKFFNELTSLEQEKIGYAFLILKSEERVSSKWVKHLGEGLYELRIKYNGNIYRIFFIYDTDNIVVLFNGFQKKTQRTPINELNIAKRLKKEYYEDKRRRAI